MPVDINSNEQEFISQVKQAAARGIARYAYAVDQEAVRLILETPKTGAVYENRFITIGTGATRRVIPVGSRPAHQASAPGEPPASDTGTLVNSRRVDLFPEELRAVVNFSTEYAAFLQFGTDRMEPRPFLDVAAANMYEQGMSFFEAEMRAVSL